MSAITPPERLLISVSRPPLYFLRHEERLAVASRQQAARALVAHELFDLPVEFHLAPHAVGDVRQVAKRCRAVAFLDVAVEQLRIARADSIDEVAKVTAVARTSQVQWIGTIDGHARPWLVLAPEEGLPAVVIQLHPALRAVEEIADLHARLIVGVKAADLKFEQLAIGVLERG